jgi:hypothetical protein
VRHREPAYLHDQRHLAVALACLLCLPAAAQTGSAALSWTAPTHNTDGTPLDDLAGFRPYWGRSPDALTSSVRIEEPGRSGYIVDGLSSDQWYFAVAAFNRAGDESALSAILCVDIVEPNVPCSGAPLAVPGPVRNFSVTVLQAQSITVHVRQETSDLLNVVVTGTGPVTLRLTPSTSLFDYFKVGGTTSADIPHTPFTGANNESPAVRANAITFTAPVNGWADVDGSALTGISATASGVTKPLVRSGSTWTASF